MPIRFLGATGACCGHPPDHDFPSGRSLPGCCPVFHLLTHMDAVDASPLRTPEVGASGDMVCVGLPENATSQAPCVPKVTRLS